jgi:glycosyltransferase involved in cell wall biosynthesis
MFHLAYVFERFPTFTQTFCVREILELESLGLKPLIFSIRDTNSEAFCQCPGDLMKRVHVLPPPDELEREVCRLREARLLPQSVVLTLRQWGECPDKGRVYEAAWIGHQISKLDPGIKHVHAHFAGVAARTCWWLRKFHGLSYSFTAHANDIFCKQAVQAPEFARLFRDASLVTTVSDYTAAHLRGCFPEAASRVQRVYNGLDLAPFIEARATADRSKASRSILSVGRLIEKKGYDDLILACALLRDRGMDFRCRIVGEGPLEENLKAQIARLNLPQVTLMGPQPMKEIIRLLVEETQIFALACKTEQDGGRDNLPTVLMEAMAAGLPCVSTRLAGVPEMVIDGETGLLCDEKQPERLAGLLASLLDDPARCERMGEAGREHAKRHFAKEITSRELLRAFAAHTSLRFDPALAGRERLVGAYLKRWWRSGQQLRHDALKARDKTFDLRQFMESA